MTTFYWDGNVVAKNRAFELTDRVAQNRGYESENWSNAWANASEPDNEESREFLSEVSNYHLEIVCDE